MNKYSPPESVQPLLGKQPSIFRFRRALRRADQKVLDHILEMACSATAPEDPDSYTLVELILLAMLLAEQKQLGQLCGLLEKAQPPGDRR